MTNYAYLIPVFPFVAFVINILFGRYIKKGAAIVSIVSSILACIVALPCAYAVIHAHHAIHGEVEWVRLGAYSLQFGYLLDGLSATLLFFVTIIGTLIQIYSAGYMSHDARFSRFFAYVSLFMSAMLTLAISNNYVLFFMAWEVMGLCSYLLIGFWFEKDSAADAGRKAFLTTRVGDVGFFLGILTLFVAVGTLNFTEMETAIHAKEGSPLLIAAGLLIFCGTIGKSAQFPLHVWLPDAMEGPTPVSALIHAATMVAAGVFLIIRSMFLFESSAIVMQTVAVIGIITAFGAACIALTANDIKKVLAYSTISQLGFCVTAMGLGGFIAGFFHLTTHAFFKALLFLGAGSVIHGTGTQDMRQMGGLFGKMKHTSTTFIIGSLAIAGVPPLAGFWSKDEILLTAFEAHNWPIFALLTIASLMTAFYMFRVIFMTFFGEARDKSIHPHESPLNMTLPLWILAVGAVLVGIPGSPIMHFWFQGFIHGPHHGHVEHHMNLLVAAISIAAGLGGISLAYLIYHKKNGWNEKLANAFKPLYNLSLNKFWFDEIYTTFIINPFKKIGHILFGFDAKVVDRIVNDTGKTTVKTSSVKHWIDKYVVDGLVNFVGYFTKFASAITKRLQTGFVQHYLLIAFIGLLIIVFFELKH